jgi:uncharacterized protein (DUF2249 family)
LREELRVKPNLIVEELLDLRSIPADGRVSLAVSAFEKLEPEGRLVIRADDAGVDLLRHLQAGQRGLFEWSPLRQGPPCWTIEIVRRAVTPGANREITESLSWDHDRLDALEAAAFRMRAEGDFQSARDNYGAFAAGLRRHIAFEEQLLFPVFEGKTGMSPTVGPTAVMRDEHREIEGLLAEIEAKIEDTMAPVESLRRRFHAVLGDHNLKEEQILYPTTDHLLGRDAADRLVERIQRF